ncbi:GNAT family N-acetyltransferase [Nostocoides veronense]
MPTVLRTPRLRLRPPTPADDDFLFALHSDPQL